MAYQIQIIPSVGRRWTFSLGKPLTKIGRTPQCDLVINDPLVSREHCLLQVKAGEMILEDLNSANGTLVNDQRITRTVLRPGDRIRLGLSEMVLEGIPEKEDASAGGTSAVRAEEKAAPLPVQKASAPVPPPPQPASGPQTPAAEQAGVQEARKPPLQAVGQPVRGPVEGAAAPGTPPEQVEKVQHPSEPIAISLVSRNQAPPVILIAHPECQRLEGLFQPLAAAGAKLVRASGAEQISTDFGNGTTRLRPALPGAGPGLRSLPGDPGLIPRSGRSS